MYSRRNEAFGKIYKMQSCDSEQCRNVTALGVTAGPSLNLSERQPLSLNHDDNNCRWQQTLNGQHITIRVNGASTICGLVSMVIAL